MGSDDTQLAGVNSTYPSETPQGEKRGHLTSHAYLPASTKDNLYTLTVYADMLKIKGKSYGQPESMQAQIGGKRGVIKGFSQAARKRMINFIASVRFSGQLFFLTLTYPDMFSLDPRSWERDFDTFRKRFQRIVPHWRGLWRIELKERLSGNNKGLVAPHFHILIFTHYPADTSNLEFRAEQFENWCLNAWYEVVGSGDTKHSWHGAHCTLVRSRKHAYIYVSKYIAKIDNDTAAIGKRWGHIGEFNCDSSLEIDISQEEYIQIRRIVRRWLKGTGRKFWRRFGRLSCLMGCTIFGLGDGLTEAQFNPEAGWITFLAAAKLHSRFS